MIDTYDWKQIYSDIQDLEKDLRGFKYKGDGWYIEETDTLYIETTSRGSVIAYCWNNPNGFETTISEIGKALSKPIYRS